MLLHKFCKNLYVHTVVFTFAILLVLSSCECLAAQNILLGKWQPDKCVITESNGMQKAVSAKITLQFFENNVIVLTAPEKRSIGGKYALHDGSKLFVNIPSKGLMYFAFPNRCEVQRLKNQLTVHGELKDDDNSLLYSVEAVYTLIEGFEESTTFPAPNLDRFTMQKEWDESNVDAKWKDTHHVKYTNSSGDIIDKLVANQWVVRDEKAQSDISAKDSIVWGWRIVSKDAKSKSVDMTKGYLIIDSNCNGTFDKRYPLKEYQPQEQTQQQPQQQSEPAGIPECARWDALSKLMKQ